MESPLDTLRSRIRNKLAFYEEAMKEHPSAPLTRFAKKEILLEILEWIEDLDEGSKQLEFNFK